MAKTVVIVEENGRLVDVFSRDKESDRRYAKFAARLLGESGSFATLNYGWSGKTKLKITGANGEQIVLDAQEVVVSGDLKVGNKYLDDIIDERVDIELGGLTGKEGEIDVAPVPNEDSGSSSDQPRNLYVIGLSRRFLDRIETLEIKVDSLVKFDDVYYAGDGLVAYKEQDPHTIAVRVGSGLKFEDVETSDSPDSSDPEYRPPTRAVAVDVVNAVIEGSQKPVTSDAVFHAVGGSINPYYVEIDPVSHNVYLYQR